MLFPDFSRAEDIRKMADALEREQVGDIRLMEVCGTHTMAIARAGLKQILPKNIRLISGPGCPVCVTPVGMMDEILRLSERKDVILASYGDMIRVPGSTPGDSLSRRKALGADARIVYSPVDAVELAKANPEKQVVFLGVGFETTAPGTAAAIGKAAEEEAENFSVLCMLKRVEPALRSLILSDDFNVDGFLCPGHVATILGEDGFRFLVDEYRIPSVICGFEAGDIMTSVYELVQQIRNGKPALWNEYSRAVRPEGNLPAKQMMEKYLIPCRDVWRGLGEIPDSGYALRPEYEAFDAAKKFRLHPENKEALTACQCGGIIRGQKEPAQCPLFGKVCVPENPVGPCMVSGEGSCAAAWRYR